MKTIIAGGRDLKKIPVIMKLDQLEVRYGIKITSVVSGCAPGADAAGEWWAETHNLPVHKYPADWNKLGKAAGPIRNREMAKNADAVILFPGGNGTNSMKSEAEKAGLKIYEIVVGEDGFYILK